MPTNWHFLSVTFDTEYDTPAVLKAYAQRYHYDPARWSFLTGPPDKIAELAALNDVNFDRKGGFYDHNFRTLIIDPAGALQMMFPITGDISDNIADEILKALDANTGQPLWTNFFSATTATTISPPTYDASTVSFHSRPLLLSLDAATGSTNWATPFDSQSFRCMAPVMGGGRVFADIGYVHGLGSFDQVTGTNQWFEERNGFSYAESAPASYNGKVYTWLGNFTEWNPTNGAVSWRLIDELSGDASRRTVAIADDRAYFVDD